jgi:hypothetical protein
VAEAHQPLAAVEHALDVRRRVALALDGLEHVQHPGGGAAVQRSGHRRPTAPDRQAATSAPVEAITRAVKVEAFMPCSAAEVQ